MWSCQSPLGPSNEVTADAVSYFLLCQRPESGRSERNKKTNHFFFQSLDLEPARPVAPTKPQRSAHARARLPLFFFFFFFLFDFLDRFPKRKRSTVLLIDRRPCSESDPEVCAKTAPRSACSYWPKPLDARGSSATYRTPTNKCLLCQRWMDFVFFLSSVSHLPA